MAPKKAKKQAGSARKTSPAKAKKSARADNSRGELVIITGLSGAGKLSALKTFEDLGYYSVDNLPIELIPGFAYLVRQSREISRAALVVDVREGAGLKRFPAIIRQVRRTLPTRILFLDASDEVILRRFSETRRPHPLGKADTVIRAVRAERKRLDAVRNVADIILDTSKFNVHELRAHINEQFERGGSGRKLLISIMSFGFKAGVPPEADLVFDVRFLPNPHFVPEFRPLTGKHPKLVAYLRQFPQTLEFIDKTMGMLLFLLPHYVHEGKSYLTVAFGCTGGQHRSVMISEAVRKRLAEEGYRTKMAHRDMPR
jgi:RNase adapter protein RapZ